MSWIRWIVPATVVIVCVLSGCLDSPTSPSGSDFSDKLTIGTGVSGFEITGETAVFSGTTPLQVSWRLESRDDMAGSAVIIQVDKLSGGSFATFDSRRYENPQSYGHIMLSSISISQKGHFRMSGILETGTRTVASKEFDVQ